MPIDKGYPTPATIRPEFLGEVEIVGRSYGDADGIGTVVLRLPDGRYVPNFPADMVAELKPAPEPGWRERFAGEENRNAV